MTRRVIPLVLAVLLGGCAAQESAVVLTHEVVPPARVGERPVNLALGPNRENARLGEWFAYRSEWPAAPNGIRLEEVATYTEAIFDDQSIYDRFGGAFWGIRESVRTGVIVR